ncbi:MAG: transglycosylase SLT domain-containing protein [Woeseiaceae bacterium]|nr:transglycosylase SLT domain-containing protein [Woeseiaceae bacterium]
MHWKDSTSSIPLRLTVFLAALFVGLPTQAADIDRQRALFQQVYETVERGDWSPVDQLSSDQQTLLESYVLWPDLRAAWLRANLKKVDAAQIDAFLSRHGSLKPGRELRYRRALQLARGGDLEGYRRIYEQFYQGQEIARLDCLALQAEVEAGRHNRVNQRAVRLWMVGTSQVEECDPVFDYLYDNNILGPVEYRQRFELAIDAREFQLARWLARSIDQAHVSEASGWMKASSAPEKFLASYKQRANSSTHREQLVYATERLTYRDPVAADRLWSAISDRYGFSESQKLLTARHIALWMARDNLPGGYVALAGLPKAAQDEEVMRWRARTSLRDTNWHRLLIDISLMSSKEQDTQEWTYWRGYALSKTGQSDEGRDVLKALSQERSYYGFLAADELGQPYALDHSRLAADTAEMALVAKHPGLVRARELFFVGLDGRGRSEWDAIVRYFSDDEKLQAALLADQWGWHSRAISTAASLGEYDDLAIRYPLPWQQHFETSSSAARISPTWAYGIARSESLFMRDVRSSAGAVGLMQLMPATGRDVARDIRLPYSGLATLTDPVSNIRLGTTYLGQMASRYNGNQVLATAAYNAGPRRVDRWLPDQGSEDARVWIENIPFNETRSYVKRVFSAEAIFHWRMTGQVRRVSDLLGTVRSQQKIAAR